MALQGTIDTFALPDVLRLLAASEKTGRLRVSGDRGTGSVWVESGGVVASEATGAPHAGAHADVVFELLRYREGSFTFEADALPPDAEPPSGMEPILAEAERQRTDWAEIEAVVPSLDATVSLAAELDGTDVVVDPDRWRAIAAIGAATTVDRLAAHLGLGEVAACGMVRELVELGLVEVGAPDRSGHLTDDTGRLLADPVPEDPLFADRPPLPLPPPPPPGESGGDADLSGAEDLARQLANLGPTAARAVASAARAATDEEREAALDQVAEEDASVDRDLLARFLDRASAG